jgi:hypothetical protein
MANGYYLFSCEIVNRSTQSVVAMAAYRSDEKLYSMRDGETKQYKSHSVKPGSFILKPDNAPDWTLDRERLWNEVERFENRENAQLARNVLLGLPNDMTEEQQLELTKEYVQENFVDEGMVADVSIHRDEEHNPHAHILLTVRPFDEHGNWEKRKSKRIPVLDEEGNQVYNEKGWRVTKSVKINDWDKRETLVRWRENWAEKLNEKSKEFGLDKNYSDKSYEEQGRIVKPRFRLTRSEYQYEEKLKKEALDKGEKYTPTTYYAQKNEEIKKYNEKYNNVIHLEDYKTKKDYKQILSDLRSNLHVNKENVEATRLLVERAKGYVDYSVAKQLYDDFNSDINKWKLNLERQLTTLNSHKKFYNNLINNYKDNPNYVERFGYDVSNFKDQVKNELANLKEKEQKYNAEYEKFNELKEATVVSLDYQKYLTDTEFLAVYDKANVDDFSYEEKHFALKLLKEYNILLPEEKIRQEYINQQKDMEHNKVYVPVWKQANDIMTSISIYNKTLNKYGRINLNSLSSEKLKDAIIKIETFKQLKSNYENHLNELTPLINSQINKLTSHDEGINERAINAPTEIKVAILEEYSKLSNEEKDNLVLEDFINDVSNTYQEKAEMANYKYESEQDQDRKEHYKDVSSKASDIATGLFNMFKDLANENRHNHSRRQRDRTKTFRRRGADGREL